MTPETGDTAPEFSLTDHDGNTVRLSDFSGERIVLYFYPKAFTPGCTAQACDFRDRHEALAAAGCRVLGVSPDPPERLARFRAGHRLPFPLLSDPDHAVAAAYGAWGVKRSYGREHEGLIRSTFVIDPGGRVERVWRNVRAKGHVERISAEIT